MELKEIHSMVEQYKRALAAEFDANTELACAKESLEHEKATVLANAQADGKIDGKNADARKRQVAAIVSGSALVEEAEFFIKEREEDVARTSADRKGHDALIGLTKAWLYSQSGVK